MPYKVFIFHRFKLSSNWRVKRVSNLFLRNAHSRFNVRFAASGRPSIHRAHRNPNPLKQLRLSCRPDLLFRNLSKLQQARVLMLFSGSGLNRLRRRMRHWSHCAL